MVYGIYIRLTAELNSSTKEMRGKKVVNYLFNHSSDCECQPTESGKVSLEEEEEEEEEEEDCFPLALLDRSTVSVDTDFCRESEIFDIQ